MVQKYLEQVVAKVKSQGKPNGNYIAVITQRAQAAIKEIVPARYRLAVRMALISQAAKFTKGI
jgi:hypothetical protein